MRILVAILLLLAAIALIIGGITAFVGNKFFIPPEGYWRGCTALLGFAIALMLWGYVYPPAKKKK